MAIHARRLGIVCGVASSLGLNSVIGPILTSSAALAHGGAVHGNVSYGNVATQSLWHNWVAPSHQVDHANNRTTGGAAGTHLQSSWHNNFASANTGNISGNIFGDPAYSSGRQLSVGAQDLNLASSQANISASNLAGFHELTIIVGGSKQVVDAGSKLTGAEALAAQQILAGGNQTIKISADGRAVGGTVLLSNSMLSALDTALGGPINDLTVSRGVRVIDSLPQLTLTGDLNNHGAILTAAATRNVVDSIVADSIVNFAGGYIGTYRSAGIVAGAGALFAAEPALSATTSLTNNGTIYSAENLTISAPLILNNGAITAANGYVNISGAPTNDGGIVFLNNGSVEASRGNINFTALNSAVSITGGDLLSRAVNIRAGHGAIDVNVDNISGRFNASGDSVHLLTKGDQILGDIDTSGDPQFVSAGNILIDGAIAPTNGFDLAIIAGGNILSSTKASLNTSTTAGGNGGNLTLIAGANFSGDNTTATVTDSANPGRGSATGGIIDLTGGNGGKGAIATITTAGVGTAGDAGYIEMVAYSGSATGAGTIKIPTSVTINAAGSGTGTNGNVVLIAGATSGTAITTGAIVGGQINVDGGRAGVNGASVVFTNGTSNKGTGGFVSGGTTVSDLALGALTSSKGVALTSGGNITAGKIMANGSGYSGVSGAAGGNGGGITIQAGGNLATGEIDAFGGGGTGGGSTGSADGGAGGNGGTINLTTLAGNITVTGNINVSGGGGGGGAGSNFTTKSGGNFGSGGKAGSVSLNSGANITVSGEILQYDGGKGGFGGNGGTSGAGAGGGGGGSYGGAGGGGAAGVAGAASNSASGGGGGGSLLAPGGGGAGATGLGTADGGAGGGYILIGKGGAASTSGSSGISGSGTKGGNGGKGGTLAGGLGGANPSGGAGGISTLAPAKGTSGEKAQVGSAAILTITAGGTVGTSAAPLKFEAGNLTITGTTTSASAYLSDIGGTALTVGAANLGANGTFSLTATANTLTGATGGPINLTNTISGSVVNILSKGALTTSGAGVISATTATLSGTTVNVKTDVSNLGVTSTTGNATIDQSTKALTLSATMPINSAAILTVTAQNQITTKGVINVGQAGSVSLEDSSATGGISIGGLISAGDISLKTGSAGITSTPGSVIIAGTITLVTTGDIGAAKSPLLLNNNLPFGGGNALTITAGAGANVYATDLGAGDLALDVSSAGGGGTIAFTSGSAALNVVELKFDSITLTDTNAFGLINLNSTSNSAAIFGTGAGAVTITSNGSIEMNTTTAGIAGTAVSLTSTAASVGEFGSVPINSTFIVVSAPAGTVQAVDRAGGGVTVVGNAKDRFILDVTGAAADVLLTSPISASDIQVHASGANSNITNTFLLGSSTATHLELKPTGDLNINGPIQAQGVFLGGNNFAGPTTLGTININAPVTASQLVGINVDQSKGVNVNAAITSNNFTFRSFVAGANVTINAPLKTTAFMGLTPSIRIFADNALIVNNYPGLVLSATDMQLSAITIGSASAPLTVITNNLRLFVNTGDAYINNTGTLNLSTINPINANIVSINTKGILNFSGDLTANSLSLASIGALNLGVSGEVPVSSVAGTNNLDLTASGGAVKIFGTVGGGQISIRAASVTVPAGLNLTAANDLTISNPIGSLLVDGSFAGNSVTLGATSLLSLGALSDVVQTVVTSATTLSLSGSSAVNNYALATGKDVTVNTTAFNNIFGGQLFVGQSLAVSGTTGGLTLTGATHTIVLPAGGSLILSAKGAITAGTGAASVLSDVAQGKLHSIEIDATGNFNSPFTGLKVVVDGSGNGGFISIKAANNVYNGNVAPSGPFLLTATGSTANGSEIVLRLTNSPAGITIGNTVGNYNIDASGVNGARTDILTSGNLTVDMNFLKVNVTANGIGGNLSLRAGKNLLITGNVDTHNGATGTYASLVLQANGAKPFVVGGDGTTVNGIIGLTPNVGQGAVGADVFIGNNTGVTVNPGYVIEAKSGDTTLNTTLITNNGQVLTPATLHITNSGSILYPSGVSGNFGTPGGIDLTSTGGNVTIAKALPLTSSLTLSAAKGTLTLPSGTTAITVASTGGNGGLISITAKAIPMMPTSYDTAASTAAGDGGTIILALTGSTALNIIPSMSFNVSRGATSTVGGNLTISNGGTLTVDPAAFTLGPAAAGSSGANLTLQGGATGSGALVISNAALINNGSINALSLNSNNTKAFVLGGATTKTNGIIDGGLTLTAETIAITNKGGGILNGTGGVLTAKASVGNAIDLTAGKGDIGTSHSAPFLIDTSDLALETAGSGYISNTRAVSLDGVTVGKTFDYFSPAAITSAVKMTTGALLLDVANIVPGLNTNKTTSISVQTASGPISIFDNATGTVTVNILKSSGAVSLAASAAITTLPTSQIGGSDISLSAGGTSGKLVVGSNLTASGAISLNATGKGTISESGKGTIITAASLDMTSEGGLIGGSHSAPLLVNTGSLSASTGKTGSAFLKNTATSTTINASTAGTSFDYTGNITSASGPISTKSLLLTLGNMSAKLTTDAASLQASTATGNLSIDDTGTGPLSLSGMTATTGQVALTSAGAIVVKAGFITGSAVSITTSGANIGSSAKALAVKSQDITVNTGTTGDVNLTNTNSSAGTINLNASTVGSLKFVELDSNAKNTATLNIKSIDAASGAISISSNEQQLTVVPGSTIQTVNGNITIQNTFAPNKSTVPLLSVGAGSIIHASSIFATNTAAGNVFIVLGAVPAVSALKPGTPPSGGPTINTSGAGQVTFGATGNVNGSITAPATVTLEGLDRTLAFNTGVNAASQIVIGAGTKITADPPVGAPSEPRGAALSKVQIQIIPTAREQTNPLQTSIDLSTVYPEVDSPTGISYRGLLGTDTLTGNRSHVIFKANLSLNYTRGHSSETGATFIAASEDTVLETALGQVMIARGAIALVISTDKGLTVYDLHDTHKNSVQVISHSGERLVLLPGRSVHVTTGNCKRFEELNPMESVGYRNVSHSGDDSGRIFRHEFEILSLMSSIAPLRAMVASEEIHIQKTRKDILKTAAILSQLAGRQPYQLYRRGERLASGF